MSAATGMAWLAGLILFTVQMGKFSPVTKMKSGDTIIQARNLMYKPGENFSFFLRFKKLKKFVQLSLLLKEITLN